MIRLLALLALVSPILMQTAARAQNFYAVYDPEVKAAACKTNETPSLSEIKAYLDLRAAKQAKTSGEVASGVTLQNETAETIDALHWMLKELPASRLPSIQACDSASCVTNALWGDELGTKLSYLMVRFGLNASEYGIRSVSRFSLDQLNVLIQAVHDLPNFMLPFGRNIPFNLLHYDPRFRFQAVSNATITFFNGWENATPEMKQYATMHELSHRMAYRSTSYYLDLQKDWLALGDWSRTKDVKNPWQHGAGKCFISGYSEQAPDEDFAETASAYRYAAKRLQQTCPLKYAYMKEKVFQGVEYLNDASCESARIRMDAFGPNEIRSR